MGKIQYIQLSKPEFSYRTAQYVLIPCPYVPKHPGVKYVLRFAFQNAMGLIGLARRDRLQEGNFGVTLGYQAPIESILSSIFRLPYFMCAIVNQNLALYFASMHKQNARRILGQERVHHIRWPQKGDVRKRPFQRQFRDGSSTQGAIRRVLRKKTAMSSHLRRRKTLLKSPWRSLNSVHGLCARCAGSRTCSTALITKLGLR
uniref:DUF1365 domain-containing protein n=1 Tax=Ascaris lumbricoides TaxID=6252 RepID=A0A0M3HXH9_ASCLU